MEYLSSESRKPSLPNHTSPYEASYYGCDFAIRPHLQLPRRILLFKKQLLSVKPHKHNHCAPRPSPASGVQHTVGLQRQRTGPLQVQHESDEKLAQTSKVYQVLKNAAWIHDCQLIWLLSGSHLCRCSGGVAWLGTPVPNNSPTHTPTQKDVVQSAVGIRR